MLRTIKKKAIPFQEKIISGTMPVATNPGVESSMFQKLFSKKVPK